MVHELINDGKTVIILGGTHDLTLPQYGAYVDNAKTIGVVSMHSDLNIDSPFARKIFDGNAHLEPNCPAL